MKTLIIDNYDSFTYNLYQYIAELGGNPLVYKNDELSIAKIKKIKPSHIIISPGPGRPENKEDFGICSAVIKELGGKIPILGVCLGHQGIILEFGGKIIHAPKVMHGKKSDIRILEPSILFKDVPNKFKAMRYHSLIGERKSIPACLKITAETIDNGLVMAIEHRKKSIFGIQFHPESIGTKAGKQILKNFLTL